MHDTLFQRLRGELRPKEYDGDSFWYYRDIFSRLPVLETQRLLLRPLKMSDCQDVFAYSRDPEVARHVLWDAHQTIGQTRGYLRYILRQYRNGDPSSYGIVLKDTGHVIGTIGFMWLNTENRSAEVGYSLAREYWNQGFMTEALRAVLDLAFRKLNLHRVEAQHETDNPASGRVMLKSGMRHEGTMRGRLFNKGRFVDMDVYAILREDWVPMH